ncbi:hypothetical protein BJL90_08140 [Clostridium formicaceticum]|nr:lactate racemase domain-containing protein [Clostridium formicaceticum]AOY78296.1 hypothetical protein BJL90_08140 [Clostridium formicaceticum]
MYRIKQTINNPTVKNVEEEIEKQMKKILPLIKSGNKIGIAAGSRGIYNYKNMIKKVVEIVKAVGAKPYIIPAMGSHGGATAEGQIKILENYGISEEKIGAPIKATMETVNLGITPEGATVYFDKYAASLDGVILINRVKSHTDFRSNVESGILKQIAVGLGKQKGASEIHRYGIYGLQKLISSAAKISIDKAPILGGIAILENAEGTTAKIAVMPKDKILEQEPKLLKEAKTLLPLLPCFPLDVLVIQEMGKNISGVGMDPNITGRYLIRGESDDQSKAIYRIVCLDLTEESHHNATGVGIADVISDRLLKKIDFEATYTNVVTSGFLERGFLPVVGKNDTSAINIALSCCNKYISKENARMALIKNTLEINELLISQRIFNEIKSLDAIEVIGEETLNFDHEGNLNFPFK